MAVNIIQLTEERLDEALQVYETVLGTSFRLDPNEIVDRMATGRGIFYMAVDPDTQAVAGIKFGYIDGDTCVGRGIAVLPAYRRQGIATRLVHQFEQDLQTIPGVKTYVFGSSTIEGIPFHIAVGYQPQGLIQFTDKSLREKIDLSEFKITYEGHNDQYQVYQIFLELKQPEANLEYLRFLQHEFPQTNVQFFFQRVLTR